MTIDSATPHDDDNHYANEGIALPVGGIGGPLRGPTFYSRGGYDWGYGSLGVGLGSTTGRSS